MCRYAHVCVGICGARGGALGWRGAEPGVLPCLLPLHTPPNPACPRPRRRKRCSALQWNPEVATQLVVASDDDMAPSLQVGGWRPAGGGAGVSPEWRLRGPA